MYHLLITVIENEMISITIFYFSLSSTALQAVSKAILIKIRCSYFYCIGHSSAFSRQGSWPVWLPKEVVEGEGSPNLSGFY